MSVFTKSIVTVAALLASVSIAAPAQAVVVFNFGFNAPTDTGVTYTGKGVITTADPVIGQLKVLTATGSFFDGTSTRTINNFFGFEGSFGTDSFLFKLAGTNTYVTNSIAFSDTGDAFDGIIFNNRNVTVYSGLTNDGNIVRGSLNFAAVPEPATWAMMLVGFAGIGLASRRKRATLAIA